MNAGLPSCKTPDSKAWYFLKINDNKKSRPGNRSGFGNSWSDSQLKL